jgi:hypothetical protein
LSCKRLVLGGNGLPAPRVTSAKRPEVLECLGMMRTGLSGKQVRA